MKNKLLLTLIIIFTTCFFTFSLIACGHTHDYTTLNSNELSHWLECECGDKQSIELHKLTYKDYLTLDKVCSVCNRNVPHTHNYSKLRHDSENHWYECLCGEEKDIAPHIGGTATCEQSAVCETCDSPYGTAKGHNYTKLTSLGNGTHIKTCTYDSTHYETSYCSYKNFAIDNYGIGVGICDCGDTITTKILNIENNIVTGVTAYGKTLSEITIPNNVKEIGNNAFYHCNSLVNIIIPNSVTIVNDYAFYSCDTLTNITMSNNINSIGKYAFYYCESLSNIYLPNTLTYLGDSAFYSCKSITNIEIPNSLTYIGSGVFQYCSSLNYNIKDNLKYLGNSTNPYLYLVDTTSTSIKTAYIDEKCKFIADYAFSNCSSLTSIIIPISVIGINNQAFSFCSKLTIYCEAESKPSGWNNYWASSRPVVWGY